MVGGTFIKELGNFGDIEGLIWMCMLRFIEKNRVYEI